MEKEKILSLLGDLGAIVVDSHVVYNSGRHGSAYVNKDAVYPHTEITRQLCLEIATQFKDDEIEAVLAPAVGGVILAQWVAYELSQMTGTEVLCLYSDKDGDDFTIRRGYDKLVFDKQVLVVEDVLNTGGSVQKVLKVARSLGAHIVGLGALCNRGGLTNESLGVPKLFSILNVEMETFPENECPMCQKGTPVNTSVGHGRKFLDAQKKAS